MAPGRTLLPSRPLGKAVEQFQFLERRRVLRNLSSTPDRSGDGANLQTSDSTKPNRRGSFASALNARLHAAKQHLLERILPRQYRSREKSLRSESDITHAAEQRVQQSMREGDFEKLSGHGKPLKDRCNPHGDPAEELGYRILKESGHMPDWVQLNVDIRFLIARWRRSLRGAWVRQLDERKSGQVEGEGIVEGRWQQERRKLETELVEINRKVFNYNLIVPFGRQVMSYKMEREISRLLEDSQKLNYSVNEEQKGLS